MSTSDLYILNKKSTTHVAEFSNGWGSGPAAWDYLGSKYIDEAPTYSLNMDHMKKVWALASDPRVARHEKIALMMTFDKSFIPLDKLSDAAEACRRFGQESDNSNRVNHWVEFGDALDEIAKQKHNRHARGVVLACTSICDTWIEPTDDYLENAWSIYADENIEN